MMGAEGWQPEPYISTEDARRHERLRLVLDVGEVLADVEGRVIGSTSPQAIGDASAAGWIEADGTGWRAVTS